MRFILTAGSVHDSTQAIPLMKGIIRKGMSVLGGRAYDATKILVYVVSKFAEAVIPPRKNKTYPQKYNKKVYKNRNQVEHFFQCLKNFRRVSTLYDKLPSSFLSFVYISSVISVLPKFPKIV